MEEKDTVQYKATELKDGESRESLLREADSLRMQIWHHEYQYAGRAGNQRRGI